MGIYLEAEKRLAELLGWTNIDPYCSRGNWFGYKGGEAYTVPRWTQNDAEAFKLMVEYEQYPFQPDDGVIVVASGLSSPSYYTVIIEDHIDKATAVRYAIVMATIRKLEVMK